MNPITIQKTVDVFSKLNLFDKGYNIYNTILFSVIGIAIYFFIVYPYLLWRKVKVDFEFIKAVLLFIGIGAIVRLFSQDYSAIGGLIQHSTNALSLNFYFQFPQMFILLALAFLIFFEVSLYLSKEVNKPYYKILQLIGLIIFIPLLLYALINITYWNFFILVILFTIVILYLVIGIFKLFKSKLLKPKVNKLVLTSQILDGIATFTAITFLGTRLAEQHVLSSLILSVTPILFIIIKIIFSLFLIWLIDRLVENQSESNYFKLFIIIIGFLTGLRDLLTIALLI